VKAGASWKVWKKRLGRALLVAAGLLALVTIAAVIDGWRAFGHRAVGARRERVERSTHFLEGHFENPQPLVNDSWRMLTGLFGASPHTSPGGSVPTVKVDPKLFRTPPESGLRVTWFGHASILVEIDGHRVLTDPVWSERASPFTWIGPKRWYEPALALADLPPLDAVVISHDHYDHLDYPTIVALNQRKVTFVVPLGIGAHLEYWGVPANRIIELDWWEEKRIGALNLVCTPARHASGRHLFDQGQTLWSGWALIGEKHRVFFSGDTGLFPAMSEIGTGLGPFDLTMLEVGQYNPAWPDWHGGPEQAVKAHVMLRGKTLLPIHWGLFTLAYHGWTEPGERALAAAKASSVPILLPKPGQSIEPEASPATARWWPNVPWVTGDRDPIVSTKMN
jgi:L-ascorbate metabolism protein UlaG (beta-lactamase superfamily)